MNMPARLLKQKRVTREAIHQRDAEAQQNQRVEELEALFGSFVNRSNPVTPSGA
jgi:hypothetical protein